MKPIWDKGKPVNELIQKYTVGRDREMDLMLAKYDVQGSLAHITMLQSIGLLEKDELKALSSSLKDLLPLESLSLRMESRMSTHRLNSCSPAN